MGRTPGKFPEHVSQGMSGASASLRLARVGRQRWQIAEVPGVRLLGGLHELAEDDLVDGQALEGVGEGV